MHLERIVLLALVVVEICINVKASPEDYCLTGIPHFHMNSVIWNKKLYCLLTFGLTIENSNQKQHYQHLFNSMAYKFFIDCHWIAWRFHKIFTVHVPCNDSQEFCVCFLQWIVRKLLLEIIIGMHWTKTQYIHFGALHPYNEAVFLYAFHCKSVSLNAFIVSFSIWNLRSTIFLLWAIDQRFWKSPILPLMCQLNNADLLAIRLVDYSNQGSREKREWNRRKSRSISTQYIRVAYEQLKPYIFTSAWKWSPVNSNTIVITFVKHSLSYTSPKWKCYSLC